MAADHDRAQRRRPPTWRRAGRRLGPAGTRRAATPGRRVAPTDRLAVMFTSGTTSEPKGVVLTQHNYAHVADTMSAIVGLRPEHRWLVTLPLFHANAQYYCIAPAIAVGASVALDLGVLRFPVAAAGPRPVGHARQPVRRADPDDPGAPAGRRAGRAARARLVRAEPRRAALRRVRGARRLPPAAALRNDRDRRDRLRRRLQPVPQRHDRPADRGPPGRAREPRDRGGRAARRAGELVLGGVPGEDIFLEYLDDPAATGRSLVERDGATWFHTGDMVARVAAAATAAVARSASSAGATT